METFPKVEKTGLRLSKLERLRSKTIKVIAGAVAAAGLIAAVVTNAAEARIAPEAQVASTAGGSVIVLTPAAFEAGDVVAQHRSHSSHSSHSSHRSHYSSRY